MSKIVERIHNVETDEIIDIEREMNADELAQLAIDNEAADKRKIEIEAKANAKNALLERLGITEAEAKLLLS